MATSTATSEQPKKSSLPSSETVTLPRKGLEFRLEDLKDAAYSINGIERAIDEISEENNGFVVGGLMSCLRVVARDLDEKIACIAKMAGITGYEV